MKYMKWIGAVCTTWLGVYFVLAAFGKTELDPVLLGLVGVTYFLRAGTYLLEDQP